MGKQEPKTARNLWPPKRKPLGAIFPLKNNEFDGEGPIGLARVFKAQKEQAMAMLVSPPTLLRLREEEAAAIDGFITDFLNNKIIGCRFLMVPGRNGLGKTNVVLSVLQKRKIRVIKISPKLKNSRQIKEAMALELFDRSNFIFKVRSNQTKKMVNSIDEPVIVVVENIGDIFNAKTRNQQFLQIFCRKDTRKLGLIGIGGSINDLQRYVERLNYLQKQFRNIPFNPYSHQTVAFIIKSKLTAISQRFHIKINISEQVLELAVSKLVAMTEDLGVMLNQLKTIILPKLSKYQQKLPIFPEEDDYQRWIFDILLEDLEGIKDKTQCQRRSLVHVLPLAQQHILRAIINTITDEELLFLSEEQTLQLSKSCLEKVGLNSSAQEVKVLLREIECYGLIKREKKGMVTRVMTMIGMEDIMGCSSVQQDDILLPEQDINAFDQQF